MKEKFYNLWNVNANRWVHIILNLSVPDSRNGLLQNSSAPFKLTKRDAEEWDRYITRTEILTIEVRPLTGYKPRKPKKVIPNMPLDPTLPMLEAGYLQDRMRRRGK